MQGATLEVWRAPASPRSLGGNGSRQAEVLPRAVAVRICERAEEGMAAGAARGAACAAARGAARPPLPHAPSAVLHGPQPPPVRVQRSAAEQLYLMNCVFGVEITTTDSGKKGVRVLSVRCV